MTTKTISREDKNAAKDFLKAHVTKIDMKDLAPDVKKAAEHILGQFDKWYLDYASVKAEKKPVSEKNPTTKKT